MRRSVELGGSAGIPGVNGGFILFELYSDDRALRQFTDVRHRTDVRIF